MTLIASTCIFFCQRGISYLLVILNKKGITDQGPHCLTTRAIVVKIKRSDFPNRLTSKCVIPQKLWNFNYLFIYLPHMLYLATLTLDIIVGYTVELKNYYWIINCKPIPVAVRSKTWVCSRSLPEIVGSNPTGGMDVCLLWVCCLNRQRSLRWADNSSRAVLSSAVCLSVIMKPWWRGGPDTLRAVAPWGGGS